MRYDNADIYALAHRSMEVAHRHGITKDQLVINMLNDVQELLEFANHALPINASEFRGEAHHTIDALKSVVLAWDEYTKVLDETAAGIEALQFMPDDHEEPPAEMFGPVNPDDGIPDCAICRKPMGVSEASDDGRQNYWFCVDGKCRKGFQIMSEEEAWTLNANADLMEEIDARVG